MCGFAHENADANIPRVIRLGAIIAHKPEGVTSHTFIQRIATALRTGSAEMGQVIPRRERPKIGHTGILDRAASGLMIILLGRATRLSRFFLHLRKTYEAEFTLGAQTSTLDREGALVQSAAPPSREAFTAAFEMHRGNLMQVPPEYSAVHAGGTRASNLARAGKAVAIAPRLVTVHRSQLLSFEVDAGKDLAVARCIFEVSGGTYIRSLARDIAAESGSCGHMSALVRTKIDCIDISRALTIEQIAQLQERAIVSADELLRMVMPELWVVQVQGMGARFAAAAGREIAEVCQTDETHKPCMLYDEEGFVGMWIHERGAWQLVVHAVEVL